MLRLSGVRPAALLLLLGVVVVACGPSAKRKPDAPGYEDAPCANVCSADLRSVLDCKGNLVASCTAADACDVTQGACTTACAAAQTSHRSIGCDYYATAMDNETPADGDCYAAFIANTWTTPVHISVEYKGSSLDPTSFTRIPQGTGASLTYGAYDATAGLAPGQVALLFLGGTMGAPPKCPTLPAVAVPYLHGTGISDSFHITTDVPVVAYEINPYGGGSVAVAGASLLIPSSAWDTNYIAVNAGPMGSAAWNPSLNIVAAQDNTTVTIVPTQAIVGGGGVPAGNIGVATNITLDKGQNAQLTQPAELTGSVITASAPVGFMAGHVCLQWPSTTNWCDHAEQMAPPVRAMGSTYVGVMYRPRIAAETATSWRLIGAVDGTQLTWSTDVGGPATLGKGQSVTFSTGTPFVVSSQDKLHPFMLFTYMSGSQALEMDTYGYGDPDFVYDVPPAQYLGQYVFFADPTYPETNLVIVRAPDSAGAFHDVTLDCAGVLTGWQSVGTYQWTRADLITGNFTNVGNCSTGRHEIHSDAPFGLQVWGWGTPVTGGFNSMPGTFTANVSYGYPAGMNVAPINDVIIQ